MRLPKGLSIVDVPNLTVAKLYDTNIVMIQEIQQGSDKVKRITLSHGGWRTKHTKKCINLVLNQFGIHLVQRKGDWWLLRNGSEIGLWHDSTWSVDL